MTPSKIRNTTASALKIIPVQRSLFETAAV
jgi:hypothetical protein